VIPGGWPMNGMHARLALLLVVVFSASLAWTQKVKVGYDKSADFGQFKTYAWIPRELPATMPLLATKIQLDVDYELEQKGLRKVESNPDLLVTYQGGVNANSAVAAHDPGFAATGGIPPPDSTMWGGSLSAPETQQQVQGTLVIDLVDAKRKQLVWSGRAKSKLDYDKQSKMFDQVSKAITEIFKKYPPEKEK